MHMKDEADFDGAKIALFVGDKLAVILRDDCAGLPYPGFWDFPGGGREADETPFACMQRECEEELAVRVMAQDVLWQRSFALGGRLNWFFVGRVDASVRRLIRLGDEGQRWTLMSPRTYLGHPRAVPVFQDRLRIYLTL